jgi:hypothetical protein
VNDGKVGKESWRIIKGSINRLLQKIDIGHCEERERRGNLMGLLRFARNDSSIAMQTIICSE